jgi:hypothetical protein
MRELNKQTYFFSVPPYRQFFRVIKYICASCGLLQKRKKNGELFCSPSDSAIGKARCVLQNRPSLRKSSYAKRSMITAAAENDHDCKNDDPGAVVVKDVA